MNLEKRNKEIIDRFQISWIDTKLKYKDLMENHSSFDFAKQILSLIERLRYLKYDKVLRLGTSMHTLVLSRSVEHGLREDQKEIRIEWAKENLFNIVMKDVGKVYREYTLIDLEDYKLLRLVETLKNTLVD